MRSALDQCHRPRPTQAAEIHHASRNLQSPDSDTECSAMRLGCSPASKTPAMNSSVQTLATHCLNSPSHAPCPSPNAGHQPAHPSQVPSTLSTDSDRSHPDQVNPMLQAAATAKPPNRHHSLATQPQGYSSQPSIATRCSQTYRQASPQPHAPYGPRP